MRAKRERTLFTRGEWTTLIGMVITVISAALVWGPSRTLDAGAAQVALLANIKPRNVNAYDLAVGNIKVGWAVVLLAILCGGLLLVEPRERLKPFMFTLHLAGALGILALALSHIGLYPGIVLAILGSIVLVSGGLVRYR